MDKQQVLQRMSDSGISVVFRTDDTSRLIPAAAAFCAGGLPIIEFTMTMPDAVSLLERGARELPEGAVLGAGTVLDAATARTAILAGAQFVVSPVLDPEVVDLCHRYGVVVIPGVLTPTELMYARRLGVDMIKIFPSCALGSAAFTEILGPFPDVRLVAASVGGLDRVAEYIAAGAEVVCIGGQAVDAQAFAEGRFDVLQRIAEELAATVQAARRRR